MKNRLFIIVAVVFFAVFSGMGWAIENPVVKDPVGSGRVPAGDGISGLHTSPNPIDNTSNLVVTGNVGGGKHFRGVVPYNAITDFGGRLGSTSLDSFLRRSAGSGDFGRYTGGVFEPYYSPTGTVATTRPGYSGVFRPPSAKIRGRAEDGFALPPLPKIQDLSDADTAVSNIRFRPMSMTLQEMKKLISDEVKTYSQSEKIAVEQHQAQMEQFQRDLKQVSDEASELKQNLAVQDDSLWPSTTKKPSGDIAQSWRTGEMQMPEEQTSEDKQLDVYEQMQQQIDDLQKFFEQLSVAEQNK